MTGISAARFAFLSRSSLAALAFAALASCASSTEHTTMLAPARSAITTPEAVHVYTVPPKQFQEIAIVEGKTMTDLRRKAASLGANGILAGGVIHKPGPSIGVGIGTGTYSYGRHSAAGFETSATFDVPTGSSTLQGTAIYVR